VTALALHMLNPTLPVSLLAEWWGDESIHERMQAWIEMARIADGGVALGSVNVGGVVEDGDDVIEF
jgi:hypothetical protein